VLNAPVASLEVYPKAPLVEVVFEMRFPGEPVVECHRDDLFDFVRGRMPIVQVPELSSPDHFKFRTYKYSSVDGGSSILAGLNQMGYSCKKYEGFERFKSELTPIFLFFIKRFKIRDLRRFGFRYVNAIPFVRENGNLPLKKYFQSTFKISPSLPDELQHCGLSFVQSVAAGSVITKIETLQKNTTGQDFAAHQN